MHYYHLQLYLLLTNHSDHLVLYTVIYLYEYTESLLGCPTYTIFYYDGNDDIIQLFLKIHK